MTNADAVDGGEVFVPDDLPERYAPERTEDRDEHSDEDDEETRTYDLGSLGVLPVNGQAPDSRGDVYVEGVYGTYWFPLAGCYLPE